MRPASSVCDVALPYVTKLLLMFRCFWCHPVEHTAADRPQRTANTDSHSWRLCYYSELIKHCHGVSATGSGWQGTGISPTEKLAYVKRKIFFWWETLTMDLKIWQHTHWLLNGIFPLILTCSRTSHLQQTGARLCCPVTALKDMDILHLAWTMNSPTRNEKNKMLSYRRETALQGAL